MILQSLFIPLCPRLRLTWNPCRCFDELSIKVRNDGLTFFCWLHPADKRQSVITTGASRCFPKPTSFTSWRKWWLCREKKDFYQQQNSVHIFLIAMHLAFKPHKPIKSTPTCKTTPWCTERFAGDFCCGDEGSACQLSGFTSPTGRNHWRLKHFYTYNHVWMVIKNKIVPVGWSSDLATGL